MAVHLLLAPAAAGKTHACLERIRVLLRDQPLAPTWVALPDRHQAIAFRRRLAEQGGGIGVHVGTFGDLYTEVLALAGESLPTAPEAVTHRLLRAAIDDLAARGDLQHYLPIQHRPGFVLALSDLIAEIKRARIEPPQFEAAVRGRGRRLEELAALYGEYQAALIRLGWADPEGLGWLAVQALWKKPAQLAQWKLVIVDGFDSFNPTQLETLKLLAGQVDNILLTISGEPDMRRPAYRRFARTLEAVQSQLSPTIETLAPCSHCKPALMHLGTALFESGSNRRAPDNSVAFVETQTTALEAREALRWLKARIVRDGVPVEQCAVIARDLSPYQTFLREAAREFGLPLRFAGGESLAGNPAIAAVLNLLELTVRNWARRPVLDALRSPYFDLTPYNLTSGDAAQLEAATHWGQVIEGLTQWEEALARLAQQTDDHAPIVDAGGEDAAPLQPPAGAAAGRLWQGLSAFFQRVTPPEQGDVETLVTWVEDLLQSGVALETQITAQADTVERDQAALAALREVLRALVLGEKILGTPAARDYADFYADLRGAVDAATYKFDDAYAPRAGHVYAANLAAARGVSYCAVALLGLSEGMFPAPLIEDPFLSDDERQALRNIGVPLEPRLRSDQQTLFYEAVTRATDYLLLTRPYLADDGEAWEPSPYWTAALELFDTQPRRVRPDDPRPHAEAASATELLAGAVRARALPGVYVELKPQWTELQHAGRILRARQAVAPQGFYEGDASDLRTVLSAVYGPAHVWSASRLETYGACPFFYFIQHALDLELREMPQPGYDNRQLGLMLHKILEGVFEQVTDPTDADALTSALPIVAKSVFDTAPVDYGFRPTPLWETQCIELQEMLADTLRNLAQEAAGFRPVRFEAAFGLKGAPPLVVETEAGQVQLHGVIDRVDQSSDGKVRVIDYKTGSGHMTPRDLVEGRRLQLPLYALAAEQVLGLGRPTDGFYWKIRGGEAGSLRLAKFAYQGDDGRSFSGVGGAIALAAAHIGAYVQGIQGGAFAPAPPRGGCPAYCPAQLFCWRYAPASY